MQSLCRLGELESEGGDKMKNMIQFRVIFARVAIPLEERRRKIGELRDERFADTEKARSRRGRRQVLEREISVTPQIPSPIPIPGTRRNAWRVTHRRCPTDQPSRSVRAPPCIRADIAG